MRRPGTNRVLAAWAPGRMVCEQVCLGAGCNGTAELRRCQAQWVFVMRSCAIRGVPASFALVPVRPRSFPVSCFARSDVPLQAVVMHSRLLPSPQAVTLVNQAIMALAAREVGIPHIEALLVQVRRAAGGGDGKGYAAWGGCSVGDGC